MLPGIRILWRWTWMLIALVVITLAVLLTAVRLAIPFAGEYREALETRVAEYVGAPVTIGEFDVEWYRLGPRLRLADVAIERVDGGTVQFAEAWLDLGFSLAEREFYPTNLALTGVDVHVRQDASGAYLFWGMRVDPDAIREQLADQLQAGHLPGDDQDTGFDLVRAIGAEGRDVVTGLLAVERLQLLDLRVHVVGEGRSITVIPSVSLHVRNQANRHQAALEVNLPPDLGGRASIRIDARDLLNENPVTGRTLVEGDALALASIRAALGDVELPELSGRADLSLWVDWRNDRPDTAHLQFTLDDFSAAAVDTDQVAFLADRVSGELQWLQETDGWEIRGRDVRVERETGAWESGLFSVAREMRDEQTRWRAGADHLEIADFVTLAGLLPLPAELAEPLSELNPRGQLNEVELAYEDRDHFLLTGAFANLGWSARDGVPGIDGLDGTLRLLPDGGRIGLASRDTTLRAPSLFRDPLSLARLDGWVHVELGEDRMRIHTNNLEAANADLEAAARMDLQFAADTSPWIDMQVDFRDVNLARTSGYLPVGIMPDGVVRWLDSAIVDGRSTSGSMILRGYGEDFPYGDRNGTFEVDFDIRDATLDYASPWPPVRGLDARVRFFGPGLFVTADSATVAGAYFPRIDAWFDHLGTGELSIRGESQDELARMVDFVNSSPLQHRLGGFFGGAEAEGEARLDLALEIPVTNAEETTVSGTLDLAGNRLVQPRFGLTLGAIEGRAEFTGTSLTLDGVSATVNGETARIDGWTSGDGLHIHAQGDMALGAVVPGIGDELGRWFEGAAPWLVRVQVPGMAPGVSDPRVIVSGESDLVGTRIRMPAPLDKASEDAETMRFRLPIDPAETRQQLDVSLGERFRLAAELDLPGTGGDAGFVRGTARLDAAPPRLRPESGLYVTGSVGRVDAAQWASAIERLGSAATEGDRGLVTAGAAEPLLSGADLEIAELQWDAYRLTEASISLRRARTQMNLEVDSRELVGTLGVPIGSNTQGQPWIAEWAWLDLDALVVEDEEQVETFLAAGTDLDPATLPPLNLRIERLQVSERRIDGISLLTRPTGDGLVVHHFQAGGRELRVSGQGEWRLRGDRHLTQLRLPISATDLGGGLETMGMETAFREGAGTVIVDVTWHGRPWEPDLASAEGTIRIDLANGAIEAVDPGPARLIGLFSVLTIPRRLALDFSDMMQRGFSYDRLEGRVNLHDGNAYVNQLEMTGPSGRIQVSGRAGLVEEDFDQTIVFRPALSYSLPVIGTIAGGTGVGMAVLLAQGVLRGLGGSIDDVTELHYTLRGTWAEPELERVRRNTSGSTD